MLALYLSKLLTPFHLNPAVDRVKQNSLLGVRHRPLYHRSVFMHNVHKVKISVHKVSFLKITVPYLRNGHVRTHPGRWPAATWAAQSQKHAARRRTRGGPALQGQVPRCNAK